MAKRAHPKIVGETMNIFGGMEALPMGLMTVAGWQKRDKVGQIGSSGTDGTAGSSGFMIRGMEFWMQMGHTGTLVLSYLGSGGATRA